MRNDGMGESSRRWREALWVGASAAVLLVTNSCFAGLSAGAHYYCQNGAGGQDCALAVDGIHASAADGSPLAIGDAFGGASAQARHNALTCHGSGAWLPEQASVPSYLSSGDSTARAEDTITLSGGAGSSAQVGAVLELTGSFTDTNSQARFQAITATVGVSEFVASVFLFKSNGAEIDVGGNSSAQWISVDGSFESGNHPGVPQVTPSGQLVLPPVSLPLNTPIPISAALFAQGAHAATATASARLKLQLPPGIRLVSESGETYGVTNALDGSVPMPSWATSVLALVLLSLGVAQRTGRADR